MTAEDQVTQLREWLIGVDVGGTFTDGVLLRPGHPPIIVKTPTNVSDPVAGLMGCLDALSESLSISKGQLLARTIKLGYGTTQAANLIVEGKGAKVGFITTRGFKDTLVIAEIGRERIGMDLTASRAPSLVPRSRIFEVRERVDAQGKELAPLNTEDLKNAMDALSAAGVEAVGLCFLWSFLNNEHEVAVAEALKNYSNWFVSVSHEVAPLLGEYKRSATTALNARLGPLVQQHLLSVGASLKSEGLEAVPLVMTSAGGLLTMEDAASKPVSLLSSGPAGGVLASKLLAERMGLSNVLCADMGGTTFDVSLITEGELALSERAEYAGQEIFTEAIDIVSIGAGGGSIGWVDHGMRLKVGPSSAGSDPGPACYGHGGNRATVTDANCQLGRLNPEGLAGGRLRLDTEAAKLVLTDLGNEVNLGPEQTAEGIISIVDAAMSDAIRSQTVAKGLDPREYTLFAYGGAAPLHAASIADDLGIRQVVVPLLAPVFSAYGIVASNIQHVLSRSRVVPITDFETIGSVFGELEAGGVRALASDAVPESSRLLLRTAQLRFKGQMHAVNISMPSGAITKEYMARLGVKFVETYERLFGAGTSSASAGIEMVTLRVYAVGITTVPQLEKTDAPTHDGVPTGSRKVWFKGTSIEVPTFSGPLEPGTRVTGPALLDYPGQTTWVPVNATALVDPYQSLVMTVN
ncbi:MAG: hydantoinase/oxoprolinase family protein [Acidimicrobiaceae bacterium]|nr:hydantoinase/oxoprolinase family protein [Acidimicrobiaceae bacterium]